MPVKEYNLCLLKQVQSIFAHLTESLLQYYIPRGFWKMFRFVTCSYAAYIDWTLFKRQFNVISL